MAICGGIDCKKRASFNFSDQKKPLYCSAHKLSNMIDVMHKRCEFDDCDKQPLYNFKGLKKTLFCKAHAASGMVDVKSKKCQMDDCETRPTYNFKGQKKALFCKTHAEEGMIDIKSKKCQMDDCEKQSTYNFKGGKAIFCSKHAASGMVDVKNKKCQMDDCETIPNYNFKGLKERLFCSKHAASGMIDIMSKRCQTDGCETQPVYNFKGLKERLFCKLHAASGMIDVANKLCSSCGLTQKRFKELCTTCFYFQNPDHVKTRNHKTRENSFMMPIKDIYPDLSLDKVVQGGCSKRRPDGHIELFTHGIIIEIDENQHAGYSCENKRTMEIFQDLGSRPLIFIRLNPDSYTIDNKKHASAFSLSKSTGQLSPKPKEFGMRFNALLEAIDKAKKVPSKEITVIELFYNQ